MARKRKSEESTPMDEADKALYSTFRCAANALSQLYTQSMNQQTLSFHAGERHALEKLYQWILREQEVESRLTVADIVTHIQCRYLFMASRTEQDLTRNTFKSFTLLWSIVKLIPEEIGNEILNEIDYGGDDVSTSRMLPLQQQSQSAMNFMNLSLQPCSGISGQASAGSVPRGYPDQAKHSVSSNAHSSLVFGTPQNCDLGQAGGYYTNSLLTEGGGARNHDPNQNQELKSLNSNDSSMDMHPDSPTNGSY